MAERRSDPTSPFFVLSDGPLIGVPIQHDGHEVTRFFTSDGDADAALPSHSTDDALHLAGSWEDLPWDELEEELDRHRHATPPSPPLEV